MDLNPSDDQIAICASVGEFLEKEVTTERVRAAEPGGFDATLWKGLADMGVAGMVAPEALGGTGSGLLDAELVTELHGRHLAPAPLIEGFVATRLLARTDVALAERWIPSIAEGAVLTVALQPAREGRLRLVPAGAVAQLVLALDGDELIALEDDPPNRDRPLATLGASPLSDRTTRSGSRTVLARGEKARREFAVAQDDWRVLTAAALVGLARRALEIGVAYAKEREQFGVPIGSFQAVAHRLADVATDVKGAELLAREAAWAADEELARGPALASMAHLYCGETAQRSAEESLHFHGGYGFTLEYDIQLYYRRAKAWSLTLDVPANEYQELADRVVGPVAGG